MEDVSSSFKITQDTTNNYVKQSVVNQFGFCMILFKGKTTAVLKNPNPKWKPRFVW